MFVQFDFSIEKKKKKTGSQSRMQHFMRGSMAGLSILAGQTELDEVIACFHKCKENLEAPPMELLQPGMEILNNNGTVFKLILSSSKLTLSEKLCYYRFD